MKQKLLLNKKAQIGNVNIPLITAIIISFFIIIVIVFATLFTLEIVTPITNEVASYSGTDTLLLGNGTISALTNNPTSGFALVSKNRTQLGFDGVNDYINITNNYANPLNFSNSNLTISFWLNTTSNGITQTIFSKGGKAELSGWQVIIDNVKQTVGFSAGNDAQWTTGYCTAFNPKNNTYYNVALRVNGTTGGGNATLDCYVNGHLNSTIGLNLTGGSAFTGFNDSTVNLEIGLNGTTDRDFNGTLDEIRLYNTSLTTANIVSINNSGRVHKRNVLGSATDSALLLYLSLNENQGTTAYDTSNYGNNGTISGASYQTDTIANTLVDIQDYNQTGTNVRLINESYTWSQLNATYNYQVTSNAFNQTALNYSKGMQNITQVIPSSMKILGVVFIIGFLSLLVIIVIKFKDQIGIGNEGEL